MKKFNLSFSDSLILVWVFIMFSIFAYLVVFEHENAQNNSCKYQEYLRYCRDVKHKAKQIMHDRQYGTNLAQDIENQILMENDVNIDLYSKAYRYNNVASDSKDQIITRFANVMYLDCVKSKLVIE